MPNKINIVLVATESDPVAAAVSIAFDGLGDLPDLRRVDPADFSGGGFELGSGGVLLVADSGFDAISNTDIDRLKIGFVQFLGCRTPPMLVDQLAESGAVVAGISPVIAPRVANRVVGFTGPLRVQTGGDEPTWGIIGFGVVGVEVARKLESIRASVRAADIRTPRSGLLAELGVRRHSLDLLIAGSDVITLHVQPGPTTAPLIAERELGLMKSGAVLINTSDSSIVDEKAVLKSLENGPLGGYATDCPGEIIGAAGASFASNGDLIITTNPLTNQIGAAQQIAKFVAANVQAFRDGKNVDGKIELIDFPKIGDPSFWSSRMSPRQD